MQIIACCTLYNMTVMAYGIIILAICITWNIIDNWRPSLHFITMLPKRIKYFSQRKLERLINCFLPYFFGSYCYTFSIFRSNKLVYLLNYPH